MEQTCLLCKWVHNTTVDNSPTSPHKFACYSNGKFKKWISPRDVGKPTTCEDYELVREDDHEAVHGYFELSYAHYLVIPRTALQSMPGEWQKRFVECMKELDEAIPAWRSPANYNYHAILKDEKGKIHSITQDPLNDYQRGRRRVPLETSKGENGHGSNA